MKNTISMQKKEKTHRPLSMYEQNVLLPILIKGLEMKKGRANAVTSKQIIQALRNYGVKISKTSLHYLINHIRTNDLMVGLMASSEGYYMSSSEQESIAYENTLLGRERELRRVRMSMQRQRRAMYLQLPERKPQLF